MRVHAYHQQAVSRTSTMLGALLPIHVVFSICFTVPVAYIYLGKRWGQDHITRSDRAWMLAVLLLWTVVEVTRFSIGFLANRKMLLVDLSWFGVLTIVPQLVITVVFFELLKDRNDLEFAMYVTQIILLCLETLFVWPLIARLVRNNTIDFYTVLGGGPPRLPIGLY